MINLYPDQQELVAKIDAAWIEHRSVLAVLPTGGGKTIVFSHIIAREGVYAAAVVHRKEIIKQISLSLALFDIKHRIVAPPPVVAMVRRAHMKKYGKSFVDPHAKVGVVSAQTLASKSSAKDAARMRWVQQCDLAVFDEAHHYVGDGSWGKAVRVFDHCPRLLHVSASPERADGKALEFCDTLVEGKSVQWLIDNNRLCKFKYFAPGSSLDVSDIPLTPSGDFNSKAFRAQAVKSGIVGEVVDEYKKRVLGEKTIVFATDVATAFDIAAKFNEKGVRALALHGGSDDVDRENGLAKFERGEYDVLVNVDLFDEGLDVAGVVCVMMARPTMSLIKFLQQSGRALRVMEGKEFAVIIDMVRNWEHHGLPSFPRAWSITGRDCASTLRDVEAQTTCGSCTQPYPAYLTQCPWCGAAKKPPAGRQQPDQVNGDLFELDVEAMQALFKKVADARMCDEDFEQSQINRRVPLIGRARELRAFRTVRGRRDVLDGLIRWWIGMQPRDRSMPEKHRRFNVRFGVDVATALTLDLTKTDELIAKVGRGFTKDL